MQELIIVFISVKWKNWDSIVYLESEAEHSVVHYNNILKVSICNNTQILNECAPTKGERSFDTMLAVESIREEFLVRVNSV